MKIEKDFLIKYSIKDYQVIKKFKSKKNSVFLLELDSDLWENKKVVVKKYSSSEQNRKQEISVLKKLYKHQLNVPQLYYQGKNIIVLEYIKGELLIELLFSKEYKANGISGEINLVLNKLADWFFNYYRIMNSNNRLTTILGDVNLRNFIFSQQEIYGFDFESCQKGIFEQDIGRLCAFILTYDPMFTDWKKKLVHKLKKIMIEKLKLDCKTLASEFKKELWAIEQRRNIEIPDFNMI